ncbi:phage major capsid protein [Aquibium microcysteis]|uniref:phage major capsid protein n=1 Tax=Aquibium microcysteis TaxID=675281 RepID=UPI00165CFB7D|nr:phage major capsid protein [Aquibium microcysteis]
MQYDHIAAPESFPDAAGAFDTYMNAFEAFKAENDARLLALESRKSVDPLVEDKLARIEQTLQKVDQEFLRLNRPILARVDGASEAKSAFERYVRRGDPSHLLSLEGKGMSVGSEPDGGFLVPESSETALFGELKELSPIRRIAGHLTVSSSVYKRPFVTAGAATGWVGETDDRPVTGTPKIAELSYPTMEIYACPAATGKLLDDAAVDVDAWLNREIVDAFATAESRAFVSGTGVNQPKGFLAYDQAANDAWAWGKVGYVATGVSGGLPADYAADVLYDLVFALKAAYRRNARFVMNRMTQSAIRRIKDDNGNYLWQPDLAGSLRPTLLGFPVEECDDMPDIAPGAASLAFGDFERGYLVVDRRGVQVLRDPYSAKPYVLFYVTKRVGGGISDFNAIKLLKFAA